jgi:hypothetical protein
MAIVCAKEQRALGAHAISMFITPFTGKPFEFDHFLPICEKSRTG